MNGHREQPNDPHLTNYTSTGNSHKGRGGGNKTPTKETSSDSRNWKKESSKVSNPKPKVQVFSSSSSQTTGGVTSPNDSSYSSRYYYREMPPRFQSHKYSNKSTNKISKSQGSKKSKDSTRWPSHSSADNWPTSPDNETTNQSVQSTKGRGGEEGVWNSQQQEHWPQNNHWTSDEESFSNSDPIADEVTVELDEFLSNGGGNKTNEHKRSSVQDPVVWEEEHITKQTKKSSPDGRDVQSPSNESLDGHTESSTNEGVWRSRNSIGSTSSVNSVGSNSSWKTASGTGSKIGSYPRSTSPRKQGRYDAHRSISVSSIGRSSGRFAAKKKPVMDLDDAIESLHSEPSGWGNLPSPKQTEIDTGTEVWGIPDDVKQKMKKDHKQRGPSWSDCSKSQAGNDWAADDGSLAAGWSNSENGISENYQWEGGNSDASWNIVVSKGKDRGGFADKVKTLVDMGFSPTSCEKALKVNSDNLEAALGDLLALTAIKNSAEQDYLPSSLSSAAPPPQKPTLTIPVTSSGRDMLSPSLSMGLTPSPSTSNSPHYLVPHSGTTPVVSPQPQQSSQASVQVPLPLSAATGLDLVNLQQILSQQLTQHKLLKQKLMIQIGQLKSTSLTPQQLQKQQQFLTANMNQVNAQINTVHQQLMVLMKLVQQKQLVEEKDGKEMGSYYTATETMPTSGDDLNSSMQAMSLDQADISKTSARTLSRLQQIISGNSQESETTDQGMEPYTDVPSMGGEMASHPVTTSIVQVEDVPLLTTAPPQNFPSSSRFSTVRSVDEIPEFKPGVPWNPHAHSNQAQIYTKSISVTTPTTPSDIDSLYSPDSTSDRMYQTSHNRATSAGFNSQYGASGYAYEQSNFGTASQPRFSSIPSTYHRSGSYSGSGYGNSGPPHYKGYSSAQQKLPPQQQGFPPPGRHHRPRLTQQNSFSGFSSNPVPSTPTGSYNSRSISTNYRGQPQYAGSSNNSQHNKWTFDGNPWGMPATSGSIWSIENSESLLNSTTPGFTEWRGNNVGRKPSLPLQLSAPTSYILLKNVSSQIDETSLREVCSEYGKVLSCSVNPFNESVLIRYSSKEEAALAKAGLEKNPSICGIYVTPSFASEIDISSFTDQRTPSNPTMSLSSALDITAQSWLPDRLPSQPKKPTSLWDSNSTNSMSGGGSNSGSSSVWSNGGVLPGLTSPWTISPQHQVTSTAQEREEITACSASPPLSTFLPNGLF